VPLVILFPNEANAFFPETLLQPHGFGRLLLTHTIFFEGRIPLPFQDPAAKIRGDPFAGDRLRHLRVGVGQRENNLRRLAKGQSLLLELSQVAGSDSRNRK